MLSHYRQVNRALPGPNRHSRDLPQSQDEYLARYAALGFDDYRNEQHRMPDTIENNFAAIQSWLAK
jgi:hypothetical protein